jgi:hypothetical protein
MKPSLIIGLFLVVCGSAATSRAEGLLYIASTPAGAQIALNGKLTGHKTPVQLLFRAGRHKVTVMKAGYDIEHRQVKVADGKVVRVQIPLRLAQQDLTPATPNKSRATSIGRATLIADVVGADVWADGRPTRLKTPITVRMPVGTHTLKFVYQGVSVERTLLIQANNNVMVRVALKPLLRRRDNPPPPPPKLADPRYPAQRADCLKQCKHRRKLFEPPCDDKYNKCIANCPGQVAGRIMNPGYYYPCQDTCKNRRTYCIEAAVSSCKKTCGG